MVGGDIFSEPQGPENPQNWSQARQRLSLTIGRITGCQPVSDAGECFAKKGKSWLRAVQSVGPAAKRGSIGHAVRVLERRRGLFPGTMLHKAPPQSLTARQQAVMGVRERKQWKESEGFPATGAATSPDPNPVVVCIVCLLAPVSVSDDQIALTNRASPQDDFGTTRGPLGFELVLRHRRWDKRNRSLLELCPGIDLPRSRPEAELLPPEEKSNWKRIQQLSLRLFLRGVIQRIGR
jgi:hypothetical protein